MMEALSTKMTLKKFKGFDREKKIHRVIKGQDQVAKHKKILYNMISEFEENDDMFDDLDYDTEENTIQQT